MFFYENLRDLGILFLRLSAGLMMFLGHGLSKLMNFSTMMGQFPDPIGWGSQASLAGAVFGEVVCPILIILGIKTRWFAVPAAFTMFVAAFFVHGNDPFATKERALLYLCMFVALFFTNGGKFSLKN